ncbi:hypothetical protein OHB49_44120 (plasmid) [Streptomyces sp. NBC_01717]|uniref:hypothetical protein n=1 Tax=Streptomyces sp. NBC_01717 TaxID=2975918 RepID=UPI002E381A82|nr:hypothetical protein [Streptomyces sp. NBC_01717]
MMGSIAATTIAVLVPGRRFGGAPGLMSAVVTLAGPIAPTLTGRLVGTQSAVGYQHTVLLTGVLLLIDPARDARRLLA